MRLTTPGPDKPLRADARRNRARVLAAAQDAFAAEGLAVPLDEIARRAGVGAGTVYRHFPTKEALFEAVILGHVEALIDRARNLADAADPGAAFFDFLSFMVEEGALKKDLAEALAETGFDLHKTTMPISQRLYAAIGALLARAQQAGAVRADIGLTELMSALTGISYSIRRHPTEMAVANKVFAIMCDGLRPPS